MAVRHLLIAVCLLAAVGCSSVHSNGDGIDVNNPATFSNPCDVDAGVDVGVCQAPFSCLHSVTGGSRCSLVCKSDADCPRWVATGHCDGPFQSPCVEGICQPHWCT